MALSNSTDWTLTARQLVTFSMRKIGVLGASKAPEAADSDDVLVELNALLKGMQKQGPFLFAVQVDGSQALASNTASYALTSTSPLRLLDVRYKDAGGREIPMIEMTRSDYWELPQKTSKGVPTQYWFDSDSQDLKIYVWPVKASVTTETIEYTYQRKLNDIDSLDNNIDVPEEWLDTLGYQLAMRLLPTFGVGGEVAARIEARAERLWQEAMDYSRPSMVRMIPEERW